MWRDRILDEVEFLTSRSSGPGGQHANKTETRVTLQWSPLESALFNDKEKRLIHDRLKSRFTDDGVLQISSQDTRSQAKNRKLAEHKFIAMIAESLVRPKKRVPSRRSRASIEKRLKNKKVRGELKKQRRWEKE